MLALEILNSQSSLLKSGPDQLDPVALPMSARISCRIPFRDSWNLLTYEEFANYEKKRYRGEPAQAFFFMKLSFAVLSNVSPSSSEKLLTNTRGGVLV